MGQSEASSNSAIAILNDRNTPGLDRKRLRPAPNAAHVTAETQEARAETATQGDGEEKGKGRPASCGEW